MSGRPKAELSLSSSDLSKLQLMACSVSFRPVIAARARIVLACAAGRTDDEVAKQLALSKATIGKWRRRFIKSGYAGLYDKQRPGRPPACDREKIADLFNKARNATASAALDHGSLRSLAAEFKLSKSSVHRYLRQFGFRSFAIADKLFADEPFFFQRLRNVAGLYLNPPDNALILGVEKQADYFAARHAQKNRADDGERFKETITLASALNIASRVTHQKSVIRQRHRELLEFLKHIEEIVADDLDIHLVTGNASMCAHPKIQAWIVSQSRWFVHVTDTSNVWLPLVEHIFQTAGNNANRREQLVSGKEIGRRIALFVADYDKKTHPFIWTKPAKDGFQSLWV